MAPFDDITITEPLRIWEGVVARTIDGAQLSLAVVELDPGSVVASTGTRTSSSASSSPAR
jgi:hypothetical protein